MKTIYQLVCILLSGSFLLLVGCNRDQSTPDTTKTGTPKSTETVPTNSSPAKPAVQPRVTPEVGIDQVQKAFSQSPAETKTKIDEAISTLQAGKTKEGIGRLKMVDAESELDAEQVQAIKDLIRAVQ